MKTRFLSLLLCLCICASLLTVGAFAAATNINVTDAGYYDSGAVKSLTIQFGWDSASANSRLTVMTERLRSAGESGTNKTYGDFTDFGYYGRSFKSWNAVLNKSSDFGILFYTGEQKMKMGSTNIASINFQDGNIPLNVDKTYYLYLWTYYGGYYYPDNLFMVLQVKDGKFQYAPATGRNSYGDFTTLRETASAPSGGNTSGSTSGNTSGTKPPADKTINFIDVKPGDYFAEPVAWAVACEITNGTSLVPGSETFSPAQTCTRAHILTFLWRAAGCPEPSMLNPYADIKESDWFYKAALWAREEGIHDNTGSYFGPNTPCTRGSTVEYFWKYAWCPYIESVPFSDVSAGTTLEKAVSWAVDFGITNGTGGTAFSPDQIVTRGQIVTFLHRYYVKPLDNSALIQSLKDAAKPSVPAYDGKLDPLPPMDYMLQPDWYMSLTPVDNMSNARLVAEYEQICKVIDERNAQDIYMSDGPYSRELVLWSALSQRCDIVERYDRGLRNGSLTDNEIKKYNELVAAYGDAEPLRQCSVYNT